MQGEPVVVSGQGSGMVDRPADARAAFMSSCERRSSAFA
jgi:hypothetical protein